MTDPGVDLDQALSEANLPCLLAALACVAGNDHILDPELRVANPLVGEPRIDALTSDQQAHVRQLARDTIAAHLATPSRQAAAPSEEALSRMMDFVLGPVPDEYKAYAREALSFEDKDPKRPDWSSPRLKAAAARMKVIIIGAGPSGLLIGIRLQQAGIPFEIIEKNSEVGGTWLENSYPGCRVDTESHTYSYSFEPNHAWPQHYSTQPALVDYFKDVANRNALKTNILFDTKVVEAKFDPARSIWTVRTETSDGDKTTLEATAVVTAVGQLNTPNYPDIAGLDTFSGETFHSARWRHDIDLTGKRVAVIGTGASAFQFIPEIADQVDHLMVFQRSPTYLVPTPNYHHDFGRGHQWLIDNLPTYEKWYRLWLFWLTGSDAIYGLVRRDPAWNRTDSVNERSLLVRNGLLESLRRQTGDGPLYDQLAPTFPVWSKRVLRDNGLYVQALKRDNVELITDPISSVTPTGVVLADGSEHAADVIIYGTGFKARDFLHGVSVEGRDGSDLHQAWSGDPRAYLGMLVPGFPNFFMMYGPNTNLVISISILFFSECAANYIMKCLELLAIEGAANLEIQQEVFEAFKQRVDQTGETLAWCDPNVTSWYKGANGLTAQNWPFRQIDYWAATSSPDRSEFRFEG